MPSTTFNFGPIARTSAGRQNDTINLASLPLHVMLNALTAATSAEEFIAWLWHNLYKPVFQWEQKSNGVFSWHHIPRLGAFKSAEKLFAARTGVREGLVSTHHAEILDSYPHLKSPPRLLIREKHIMCDQGDQVSPSIPLAYANQMI